MLVITCKSTKLLNFSFQVDTIPEHTKILFNYKCQLLVRIDQMLSMVIRMQTIPTNCTCVIDVKKDLRGEVIITDMSRMWIREIMNLNLEIMNLNLEIMSLNLEIMNLNLEIMNLNLELMELNLEIISLNLEIMNTNLEITNLNLEIMNLNYNEP